ncbi:hypothetical protein [Selenomonas sp.]|uniref:hypothetical protein n=1 Tax=Selenomonas sp. TaxID=2053611 RepID=UPI002A82D8D5|nr:hypothetical protein [Selenomonas sp.]MDY4414897.1 hypothetical protein [Selenomonas sp.]
MTPLRVFAHKDSEKPRTYASGAGLRRAFHTESCEIVVGDFLLADEVEDLGDIIKEVTMKYA